MRAETFNGFDMYRYGCELSMFADGGDDEYKLYDDLDLGDALRTACEVHRFAPTTGMAVSIWHDEMRAYCSFPLYYEDGEPTEAMLAWLEGRD